VHLAHQRRINQRASVYQRLWELHGFVPCYVCGQHVKRADATLEHILPRSRGGSDAGRNLSISHAKCNHARGSMPVAHVAKETAE
jgi:5-methylcytosine-specific restriction endonuclease McrA